MKSKSEKTHKLRKTEHTWLKFSFPAIFFVTLFMLYPIVYSLFLSLFKHKGLKATFVGLNNYIELFQDSVFSEPIPWLTETGWARVLVIIALCWRWTGYNAMYYIAGLQNIPRDIIEAARIDGVNPVQEFFRIIVPQLKQMIIFTSITSTIGTLQLFDEIVNLTKGGPSNGTLTVAYYTYNMSFANNNNFGYSAAISWVVVIIIAVLSLIQLKTTKEDG